MRKSAGTKKSKIPYRTRDSSPRQSYAWLFSRTAPPTDLSPPLHNTDQAATTTTTTTITTTAAAAAATTTTTVYSCCMR